MAIYCCRLGEVSGICGSSFLCREGEECTFNAALEGCQNMWSAYTIKSKCANAIESIPPATASRSFYVDFLFLKISSKLHRILEIWCANRGVVSLQLFHNTTADEAFTREACLIEAIGKGN